MRYIRLVFLLFTALLSGCENKPKNNIADYFDETESRKILAGVVRRNYYNEGIPAADRYLKKYDEKYEKVLPSFSFYKYGVGKNHFHYFILYRLHHKDKYRAVGGRLKLDNNKRIVLYKEFFATPLLLKEELNPKSDFLFDELLKQGCIKDEYLKMKQYVEWPSEFSYYDTITYEWKIKLGLVQ